MAGVVLAVYGDVEIFDSVEDLLRAVKARGKPAYVVIADSAVVLRVEGLKAPHAGGEAGVRGRAGTAEGAEGAGPRIALVFDQMFRGFAERLARELPGNYTFHEILGRGLEKPVQVGRIYRWPAHDDYDVLKVVEKLSGEYDVVVFFTGDKKLASQAAALEMGNVRVEYMPPNEYPGKESLTRAMLKAALEARGGRPG